MKKIFLITVLLGFTFLANGCSDDDTPDCGCNGNLNQTVTEIEGILSMYEDDNGDTNYSITDNSDSITKIFYVCNKDFVNSNINVNEATFIFFSGKYTNRFCNGGNQPQDATPRYSMKLTQIELQ